MGPAAFFISSLSDERLAPTVAQPLSAARDQTQVGKVIVRTPLIFAAIMAFRRPPSLKPRCPSLPASRTSNRRPNGL